MPLVMLSSPPPPMRVRLLLLPVTVSAYDVPTTPVTAAGFVSVKVCVPWVMVCVVLFRSMVSGEASAW